MSPLVLVVEDDEAIKFSLCDVLHAEDFRVLTARDGREALAILQGLENPPQLILIDLVMPYMDGQTFLRRKSEIEALCEIPVLVLSAAATVAEGRDILGQLRKPFELTHLQSYLREVI